MEGLRDTVLVSETEVRTQLAIPLLDLLGYPRPNRAEEFPIFGYEGRTPLRAKPADIVLFDSPEHHVHRDRSSRGWVADHALVVVELKKPGEPLDDAQGQAQFYSHWAKAPFYATSNGEELIIHRMQGFFDDVPEMRCPVSEIPRNWPRLRALLGYENVRRYCAENSIKAQDLPAAGYADYLRALYGELSGELELSMERTVSEDGSRGAPPTSLLLGFSSGARADFPIGISGTAGGERLSSAPYRRLLEAGSSVVVLSEPGGGKTHLTKMLARDLVLATEGNPGAPVPVVLKARSWGREFGSFAEGVRKEIESFVPGVVPGVVEQDLAAGRVVVLLDGLDEAPREGADLLRAELLRVAGRTPTRLILTCRRQDYRQELADRFDECSIDPLTDEQIEEYTARELAGVPDAPREGTFLHSVGERVAQLVRTPLFLVMTVAVMRTRTGGRVPENRAELYRAYAHTLLTEWERLRMTGRPFEVDVAVKVAVLAEYARVTWRCPPDERAFSTAVLRNRGVWNAERVRDELLRSGLLQSEAGGPEFFHPSFREYFFALGLSEMPDDELSRFADEKHSDDALAEVFAFLVGLLGEESRQALVLDRLETGNLYVFGRCLRTRAGLRSPRGLEWPDRLAERYLRQLRTTYARLAETHLAEVRHLLPPWRFVPHIEDVSRRDVAIGGYLDAGSASLSYELEAVERPSSPEGLVTLGLTAELGPGQRNYRNLSYDGKGLDSAREVAFADLKKSVEKVLKKKELPLGDNHPLGVEYVEEQLRELRSRARWGWVPEDFRDLSLRCSVEEVIGVVDWYLETYGGPVAFAKPRDPSVGGFIETPVDFPRIREYLGRLEESELDPRLFLPPERDVTDEELRRLSSGGSVLVDKFYSDEAVALYVARYYDMYQSAYRWIAENLFPSLKHQLGFYRLGPVKHRALIFRNMDEGSAADRLGRPSWVHVSYEPVAYEAEAATVCEVTHERPADGDPDADGPEDRRAQRALRETNGEARSSAEPLRTKISHGLTYPMRSMAVHEAVYRQLRRDIVQNLMEGTRGRRP